MGLCNTCMCIDWHAAWCPNLPKAPATTPLENFLDRTAGKAATPEPAPEHNNHPATADVVAGDIIRRGLPLGIAQDVMARKGMGLKKYGTALQPCNGRDNLNDLYQELVDGVKYAMTEILEQEIERPHVSKTELMDVYENLLDILETVYTLKSGDKSSNGASCT